MMSPIVPGALATIALPPTAPKNLTTMISVILVAFAAGMMRTTKKAIAIVYTGRRPHVSDIGARVNEPTARPSRYVVTPKVAIGSEDTWNSFCIAVMLAVYDVE